MTRALVVAVVLVGAACNDRPRPRHYTVDKPARAAPDRAPRHPSHEHPHGPHPHSRSDHHHHPHPHPHLDGQAGHHHPY